MKRIKSAGQYGFTLLELLVVIAVIGVLASISVSRYQAHIERSNRQAAIAGLYLAQQSMERFYLRTSTYVNALSPAQIGAIASNMPAHTFSVKTTTATNYVLQAAPNGVDACGALTIDQTGLKTVGSASASLDDCWR